jgi:hypothetical protein
MNPERLCQGVVVDAEDVDVTESDQQLTDADRVRFHRGSPI